MPSHTRPFGNVPELLSRLAAEKLSPRTKILEQQLRTQKDKQFRSDILTQFLSSADLTQFKQSDLLGIIGTITNDPDVVSKSAEIRFTEGIFQQNVERMQRLGEGLEVGDTNKELLARNLQSGGVPGDTPNLSRAVFSGTQGKEFPTAFFKELTEQVTGGERTPEQATQLFEQETGKRVSFTKGSSAGKNPELFFKFLDRSEKFSSDFQVVRNNMINIESAVSRLERLPDLNRVAIDQIVIISLNKILDPDSVVRESEYDRTKENIATVSRAKGWFNRLKQGGSGLTKNDLIEIRDSAREMAELRRQILNKKLEKQLRIPARRNGLNPDEVAPLFDSISSDLSKLRQESVSKEEGGIREKLRALGHIQ